MNKRIFALKTVPEKPLTYRNYSLIFSISVFVLAACSETAAKQQPESAGKPAGIPERMKLTTPVQKDASADTTAPIDERCALTLILDKNHEIYWYEGFNPIKLNITGFDGANSVRDLIIKEQERVKKLVGDKKKLVVLIKNTTAAKYKDIVNMLDIMDLTDVKRYSIQEISDAELESIQQLNTTDEI